MSGPIIIRGANGVTREPEVMTEPQVLIHGTLRLVSEEIVRLKLKANDRDGLNKDQTEQLKMYVKILRELLAEKRTLDKEAPEKELTDEELAAKAKEILEKKRSTENAG